MAIHYKLEKDKITHEDILVRKTEDGNQMVSVIPLNEEGNADYQNYLAWVAEGNTVTPADPIDDWPNIREKRDKLLSESDWSQGVDSPLSAEKKTEWITYREKLRNLPSEQSSKTKYLDIVWPTKPADE